MSFAPVHIEELSRTLAACHAARRPVPIIDLSGLAGLREHTPADMTVTVEGGMNLAELQTVLTQRGQWLPIDPPHSSRLTIRQVLAENLSGPRRCGFGTIREHLLGIEAVLADGRVVHSGGKVVKNVAGYDLLKLFVGARDSLGIITAATFKLRPLPAAEEFLTADFATLEQAWAAVESVMDSPLSPVALDLDNLQLASGQPFKFTLCITFAGSFEEVAWQKTEAVKLGFSAPHSTPAASLPPAVPLGPLPRDSAFWSGSAASITSASVLTSKLAEALLPLGHTAFIARAANGVFYHYAAPLPCPVATTPSPLASRLKDAFDPHHILPAMPL